MASKLFKKSALLGVFIFLVNFLAMKFFWYYTISWFDMPMHFLGGLFIGLLTLAVYFSYPKGNLLEQKVTFGRVVFVVVLSTLIVAILWELFEFSLDTFITFKNQDIFDSLSDICFGLAGAFAATSYFRYNPVVKL